MSHKWKIITNLLVYVVSLEYICRKYETMKLFIRYFAAKALQGIRASKPINGEKSTPQENCLWDSDRVAKLAVSDALALMEELEKWNL